MSNPPKDQDDKSNAKEAVKEDNGWLVDLYPDRDCMALWLIADGGERLRLIRPFSPAFFVQGLDAGLSPAERRAFDRTLAKMPSLEAAGFATRLDFWTGRPQRVFEIRILDLGRCKQDVLALSDAFPGLVYYNCDIPPEILFCYETGLFPTARCRFSHAGGYLLDFTLLDDPLAVEYSMPPLRQIELRAEGIFIGKRKSLRSLAVQYENETTAWDDGAPEEILHSFRRHLERIDPDVVWTAGGDVFLMQNLFQMAQELDVPLGLDRDPNIRRSFDYDGHSYMSYGRVLYHAPDYPLYGRLHFDRNNSFWVESCRLEGLIEVARMAKIPLQRTARRSIGTGISSIQLDWAYRHGYLIPWRKSQHEDWKSAWSLMQADRGGLVFQPIVGAYEDVWELDFVSMYPSIMVNENVSSETINCACCEPAPAVPELGYGICKRRKGVTAETLAPIIAKRVYYKAQRKKAKANGNDLEYRKYNDRQDALKWLLVCCFGYLGYRNARFGRIEAHESTCAFSREKLLKAKALCEARGFRVLHAIVDSFWIKKKGSARGEIEELCAEIDRATNLTIAIEGRYRWLAFLPSRQNPDIPVPNRYFGAFEDGSLKFRGVEARRSDQAPFVKRFQLELLERLSGAADLRECRAMRSELAAMVRDAEARVRGRELPLEELLLHRKTSREAEDYKDNNMIAVAARQAKRAGINLHAGEAVSFLVLRQKDKDLDGRLRIAALLQPEDAYDTAFYVDQVRRAAAAALEPLLGETLMEILGEKAPAKRKKKPMEMETGREQLDFSGLWGI